MRKLIYGMNLTLDGYVAAPGVRMARFRTDVPATFEAAADQGYAIKRLGLMEALNPMRSLLTARIREQE